MRSIFTTLSKCELLAILSAFGAKRREDHCTVQTPGRQPGAGGHSHTLDLFPLCYMGVNSSKNFINRAAVVRHSAEEGMTRVLLYIFRGRIRGNLERLGTRELDFIRRHRLVSCFPVDGMPGHWRQKEEPVTDVRPQNAFAQ